MKNTTLLKHTIVQLSGAHMKLLIPDGLVFLKMNAKGIVTLWL